MWGSFGKRGLIAILVVFAFLISSCEPGIEAEKETDIKILTASVVEQTSLDEQAGCKYKDGTMCTDECCRFGSGCGSFRKCDLESNEWVEKDYIDSGCSEECRKDEAEAAGKQSVTEEDKEKTRELIEGFMESAEQEPAKTCDEGWICANSTWRAYRMQDCTLFGQLKCEGACKDSKCIESCEEGEKKCKGSRVVICEDNSWETFERCDDECSSGLCITTQILEFQNESQETQEEQEEEQDTEPQDCSGCIVLLSEESVFDGTVKCTPPTFNEFIVLKNECSDSCSLEGWMIEDAQATKFFFAGYDLEAQSSVRITTGKGANSSSNLFWERCIGIWNNAGDTVFLRDKENNLILQYSYP
jgi:hypothetical protein